MEDGRRCGLWLTKKRRYCGAAPLPGTKLCGNHQTSEQRVPCTLDPSHTVAEHKMARHLRICPAAKQLEAVKQCSYYMSGINAGSDDDNDEETSGNVCKRTVIESLPKDSFEKLVARIEAAHTTCRALVPLVVNVVKPSACTKWLNFEADRRHPAQEKHTVQQASMLGNLEEFGLVSCGPTKGNGSGYIEFGAGRGYLSHMLADCYRANNLVLVERRSYKFKADRTLRYSDGVSLNRLRVDIEDLQMDGVETLRACDSIVAVSKHLCGAATDMALRCCFPATIEGVSGIGFATCCHHLCNWKAYVNKDYMRRLGFSKSEFEAVTWLTSWGLSGERDKKAELGFKCKDVLDMGRVAWLEERVKMQAKMVLYVDPETSPENRLIMARRVDNCP